MEQLLHTPEGVRDIYHEECAKKLALQNRLHKTLHLYGYHDIQTPMYEYFDVFRKEIGTIPSRELYKFFDRDGNTLVLRPDITPQIARATATLFKDDELPARLCYVGNTFINHSSYQGRLKESTQMGAEMIGLDAADADAEMLALVIDCLKNAGLEEFQVEIGNVLFFKGLLKEAGIDGDEAEMLVRLIEQKNYFGVEELLNSLNIDKRISDVLLQLPQLFGSIDVLHKAAGLTKNQDCLAAIDRLLKLYDYLKIIGYDKYISFDLGALSNHGYYTGIIFAGYTFGVGEPVVNGGRYDKLIGQFGCDKASIGFSMNVDTLMAAMNRQKLNVPVDVSGILLVYAKDNLVNALKTADAMRKMGNNVCMLTEEQAKDIDSCCEYAANSQIKDVVLLKNMSADINNSVTVIDAATKKEQQLRLAEILGGKLS